MTQPPPTGSEGRAAEERRGLALEAALSVAARVGLVVDQPAILADSNNTIVLLSPSPVVAKVGTSHFRDAELESLRRELAVAAHLSGLGAPVVAPAPAVDAGPHRWRNLTLTLWEYVPSTGQEVTREPAETAAALSAVHMALAGYPGELPRYDIELADARRLLQRKSSPTLSASDRRFLLGVVDELQERLPVRIPRPRPLAVALFAEIDLELVARLRRMRSVCVAAKCWTAPNRSPEVHTAAHVHLKLLRGEPLD
jgi:hypothetical protein